MQKAMKLLIFGDLHYFGGDISTARFDPEKKQVRYALPMLEHVMKACDADVCVNLGDLIQDDYDKQRDLEVFARIHERLAHFPCPCHSILGNHELKMMDTIGDMEAVLGHESTYSIDHGGYHLVFLSPEVRPELGIRRGGCYKAQYLGDRTIRWLEDDLAKNKLPVLVFTHYPLAEDETEEDPLMFMKDRAPVKEILKKDQNLLAVFSGHRHVTKAFGEDGVRYYLTGALCPSPDENGAVCGEYMEVVAEGGSLEVTNKKLPVSAL
jgi:3',5'-cyclic AMP phosphodiesterase CpdA